MNTVAAGCTYEAAGDGASPFQHFWSLSVQAQFLLLWPAAAFLLFLLLRATGSSWSSRLFAGVPTVMVSASFGCAIWLVGVNQPVAYYSLAARLWEFGLGALAALLIPRLGRFQKTGAILALSLLLAFATNQLVANPFFRWSSRVQASRNGTGACWCYCS